LILKTLPDSAQKFLLQHRTGYEAVNSAIQQMQQLDIIMSPPPIKKQTLAEKMHIIKNFDQCLEWYNRWIEKNPDMGSVLSSDDVKQQSEKEYAFWNSFNTQAVDTPGPLAIGQSTGQNDDNL
jgi:hypothetical protein